MEREREGGREGGRVGESEILPVCSHRNMFECAFWGLNPKP